MITNKFLNNKKATRHSLAFTTALCLSMGTLMSNHASAMEQDEHLQGAHSPRHQLSSSQSISKNEEVQNNSLSPSSPSVEKGQPLSSSSITPSSDNDEDSEETLKEKKEINKLKREEEKAEIENRILLCKEKTKVEINSLRIRQQKEEEDLEKMKITRLQSAELYDKEQIKNNNKAKHNDKELNQILLQSHQTHELDLKERQAAIKRADMELDHTILIDQMQLEKERAESAANIYVSLQEQYYKNIDHEIAQFNKRESQEYNNKSCIRILHEGLWGKSTIIPSKIPFKETQEYQVFEVLTSDNGQDKRKTLNNISIKSNKSINGNNKK